MLDVSTVANFFLEVADQCGDDSMTNLKLNKLLYYAQGHYIALTGEKLFPDEIMAWEFGPVVPSVYSQYKRYKSNTINAKGVTVSKDLFTTEQYSTLLDVVRAYSKYAGFHLVGKTHRSGTPWSNHWSPDKRNTIIPIEEIKEYFSKSEKITTFDEILANSQIPIVEGTRNADGILVFPEDDFCDEWLDVDEM